MLSESPDKITPGPNCVGKYHLFDGEDVENRNGVLIRQKFPFEVEAKALCNDCPVFDWCRLSNWNEPYTIVAGRTPSERKIRKKT